MDETGNNFEFEICANSVESCLAAQEGGANRVELCAGIPEGGTTPSYGDIVTARGLLSKTKLHVIIRPRGGDFTYSDLEMDIMEADIEACKMAGVDGVVFGCLTPEGDIDIEKNARLMARVGNMAATFHRAFDRCRNPLDALEQIAKLGFSRVLTSGQQKTAEKGIPLLYKLHKKAGDSIAIMAGCGVNERNIFKIHCQTNVTQFHFSARESVQSPCAYMGGNVKMGGHDTDESYREVTTARRVSHTIMELRNGKYPS